MKRWAYAMTLGAVLLSVLACGSRGPDQGIVMPGGEMTLAASATQDSSNASVPAEYQELYESVSNSLVHVETFLAGRGEGHPGSTTFGAELIIANGNRGEALLLPETMIAVLQLLDQLQEIGVGGVTLQISDPLLSPEYPRSSEYMAFFREVAEEVRGRGLKLMVEAGPVFADPQYSRVQFDWSGLTLEQFFQMRADQLVLIAEEVQPDYLSLGNEPSTQMMLTGLTFSTTDYMNFIRDVAASIDRSGGVQLGAGAGTWEDPAYLERLLDEPSLDFLNIHIYPLSSSYANYVERAAQAASAAREQGMAVVIGETWLYKAGPQEIDQLIAHQEVYARDVYSFWQPLDIRYIETIVELAQVEQLEYVSFFWSGHFFGYLEYGEGTRDLSPVEAYQQLNRVQYANIVDGILTDTGRAYQSILEGITQP